jgi:four helix bundle protein
MAAVDRFEDLFAWQLSSQLRDEILPITDRSVWKDSSFRDQIRDSVSSPPRNIAEGFGRFRPREFAYFVRVAAGSLQETRNHLYDARKRKYINDEEANRLLRLQARAGKATTKLLRYLESCDGEPPGDENKNA